MGKKVCSSLHKLVSYIKDHWFISMVVAALFGALASWGIQWVLPSKEVNVRGLPHKELTCTLDFSYQMITRRVLDGSLQVFYDGKEVESPYIYSITLENTGDYSISNEDFKEEFSILFSGSKQIVQARVLKSSSQSISDDVLAGANVSGNKLTIDDFYLNTGESFTIHIVSDGKPDDIIYHARISDISTLTLRNTPKEKRDARLRVMAYFVISFVCVISVVIVTLIILERRTIRKMEEYQNKLEIEYGLKHDQ